MKYFLLSIYLLTACSSQRPAQPDYPAGRYAVQWQSYLGAWTNETVYPQFSFIDVHRASDQAAQFNHLELIAQQDIFPVKQVSIAEGQAHIGYQTLTVLSEINWSEPGTYTVTAIRYQDEHGDQQ